MTLKLQTERTCLIAMFLDETREYSGLQAIAAVIAEGAMPRLKHLGLANVMLGIGCVYVQL